MVNIYYKNGQKNKGSWRLDLRGNKNYKKDLKKRFWDKTWVEKVNFTDCRTANDVKAEVNKKRTNHSKENLLIINAQACLLLNLLIFGFENSLIKNSKL